MVLLEPAPQKTLPQFRQWCLRLVNVKAVRHRMQTSESVHSGGYERCQYVHTAHIKSYTYSTTIEHAAGDVLLGRELVAFAL
jgi:hypothetical protein